MDPRKLLIVFLFSVFLNLGSCDDSNLYDLVLHSKERGAACLDGSPAGMYIHEGSGANKNKFIIYFHGGGFCAGLTLSDTI